jgi:hypothetical protein
MMVGISTFAVVTAKLAEWLVRGDQSRSRLRDFSRPEVGGLAVDDGPAAASLHVEE